MSRARANHPNSSHAHEGSAITAAAALDAAARELRQQLGQELHWHAQALSGASRDSLRSLIGLLGDLPAAATTPARS